MTFKHKSKEVSVQDKIRQLTKLRKQYAIWFKHKDTQQSVESVIESYQKIRRVCDNNKQAIELYKEKNNDTDPRKYPMNDVSGTVPHTFNAVKAARTGNAIKAV